MIPYSNNEIYAHPTVTLTLSAGSNISLNPNAFVCQTLFTRHLVCYLVPGCMYRPHTHSVVVDMLVNRTEHMTVLSYTHSYFGDNDDDDVVDIRVQAMRTMRSLQVQHICPANI